MNEQEAREQAEQVLAYETCPTPADWPVFERVMVQRISRALLSASKPPPPGLIEVDGVVYGQHAIRLLQSLVNGCIAAGFIDNAMNVRKVLGTLPLTADGYLAGSDAELWWVDNSKYVQMVCVLPTDVSDCYSTREAAEAAREAKP